jgi:hypothetical protein
MYIRNISTQMTAFKLLKFNCAWQARGVISISMVYVYKPSIVNNIYHISKLKYKRKKQNIKYNLYYQYCLLIVDFILYIECKCIHFTTK